MPHSIKKFNGNIHILDSLKGDLRNGDKEVLGTFPGFSEALILMEDIISLVKVRTEILVKISAIQIIYR